MSNDTNVHPNSDFYWGASAMKAAMLAVCDAHASNIELGFPPELVLSKLREHMSLITADMVVSADATASNYQSVDDETG